MDTDPQPATELAIDEYGPWNPGILSELSPQLLSLCTIFRKENVFAALPEVSELAGLTGLELTDLVVFRPSRLALHELLVRVTADIEVPDPEEADVSSLGVEFRQIVDTIHTRHLLPRMEEIVRAYEKLQDEIVATVEQELAVLFGAEPREAPAPTRGIGLLGWRRWKESSRTRLVRNLEWEAHQGVIDRWVLGAGKSDDLLRSAVYRSLAKTITAVRMKHGRIWGSHSLLASIAVGLACNEHAGEMVGQLIDPYVKAAVAQEGLRLLPSQEHPIAMSTKGSSASGKSTMRPNQRKLATRMGASWRDFALISPDIFRRSLLDFNSLGNLSKYAGVFTSHELNIVDNKLDRHLERKAANGRTPHILIDRFRFDSFVANAREQWEVPARFGRPRLVHLLFMVTPPEETVERAWKRGLEIGRYKPVSDLLAHNVEAYSGMHGFFFARVLNQKQAVHYEFLDNGVPPDKPPLTIAFGQNNEMHIFDVRGILNIDRFRHININATCRSQVYLDCASVAASERIRFLSECVKRFPRVDFADRSSGRIWALVEAGELVWCDPEGLSSCATDDESRAALEAVLQKNLGASRREAAPPALNPESFYTIGLWGESRDAPLG